MRTITQKYIWMTLLKIGIFLLVTAFLLTLAAGAALFITARGPSADASQRLAATLAGSGSPLAHVFFSEAELENSLIYAAPHDADGGVKFSYDDDGNQVYDDKPTLTRIKGSSWSGVILENIDVKTLEVHSASSKEESKKENASGVLGLVSPDVSLVGDIFSYDGDGSGYNVVGLDANGILHAGRYSAAEVFNSGWRFAVSAERVLVSGGVPFRDLGGGYATRAAIGQKKDGSIIIVLMKGHGIYPCGATYDELAAVMYEHGAVTAAAVSPVGAAYAGGKKVFSAGGTSRFAAVFDASFTD